MTARFRLGLRGRYTLYGAALTTAVVVALTTLSYFNTRALAYRGAQSQLQHAADTIATPIEQALQVAVREVRALTTQPLLANALLDSEGRDAYLRPFLTRHTLPVEMDYNLVLVDFRGDPVAARRDERSYRGASWFASAMERGEPVAGLERRDGRSILYVVAPIRYRFTGTFEGALVFETDLATWLGGPKLPASHVDELAAVELFAGATTVAQWRQRAPARTVTAVRGIEAEWPLEPALRLRVAMDEAVFQRPLTELLFDHIAGGVLAVLLVAGASGVVARAQTRRIEKLAREARRIARGDVPRGALAAAALRNDEIGELAASLAHLLGELTSHQVALEALVAQRTAELAAREADLNRAQAIAQVGSWVVEPASGTNRWSAETCRIFGVAVGTCQGYEDFMSRVHPDDRLALEHAWQAALRGRPFAIEHRIVVAGEVRWVREQAELAFAPDGRLLRAVGTVQDISERRLAEARMHEAMVVFNASSQGIMKTDARGVISSVNPAFCRITGFPADEVLGRTPAIFRSGRHDETFYEGMWSALTTRGEWEGEVWNRRKSGDIYPQWLTISAVRDSRGQIAEYVALFSDITERKQHEDAIWRQANFDALTGLANRSLLHDRLARAIAHAKRSASKAGLLFLDLDGFKWVNDTLGHDVGDQLLVEVASRLAACVRQQDTVARLGGDEFTIVVGELEVGEDLRTIAENALAALHLPFALAGSRHHISASIGITVFPDDGDDVQTLLRNADIAMYKSKQGGKNCFHFYARHMQSDALARMRLEADLREALARGDFTLAYQPIVDARTGQLTGAEALLRWPHAERGSVPPAEFIPVAEDCGLIVPIGEWVLREAARQWQRWHALRAAGPLNIAVNMSGVQFRDSDLPGIVGSALREHRVEEGGLTLEICESVLIDSSAATESRMRDVKALGIRFALDDFGTGYSSLSCLKRFPVDVVKIDRSFIRDCPADRNDALLVDAIISMAHGLGLKVVAEGVETAAQAEFLRELGCDFLQGYLIAPPLPVNEFEARMLRRGAPPGARHAA